MKFEKFKQLALGTTLGLLLITSNSMAQEVSSPQITNSVSILNDNSTISEYQKAGKIKVIKEFLSNKLENTLKNYQAIGLYDNVKNVNFKFNFNTDQNYTQYSTGDIYLGVSLKSSLNSIFLHSSMFHSSGNLEEQKQYDFNKTLLHELGHLQFVGSPSLLDEVNSNDKKYNEIVNLHINSDILLSNKSNSINTTQAFIAENISDTYAELAYLKINNFSNESIQNLKEDILTRQNESLKVIQEYGPNYDSHDTAEALKKVLQIISDPVMKKQLQDLPGKVFDGLAKSIVFNTYQDYLSQSVVQENIKSNNIKIIHKEIDNKQTDNENKTMIKIFEDFNKEQRTIDIKQNILKLRDKYKSSNTSDIKLKI